MPSSPTAPKTSRLVGPIPKCSALAHQCLNLSGVIFIWLPFPWPILCNSGSISVEPHGSFQTSRLKKLGLIFLLNGYLHFPISAQLPYCPPFVSLSLFSFHCFLLFLLLNLSILLTLRQLTHVFFQKFYNELHTHFSYIYLVIFNTSCFATCFYFCT